MLFTLLLAATASATPIVRNTAPAPVATFYPKDGPVYVTGLPPNGTNVNQYLGVPFAAAPVGDLRFAPPQTACYNGTVNATAQPPSCMQAPGNSLNGVSEDCLFLNIVTPSNASDSQPDLPVIVWIYGGYDLIGGVNNYDGSPVVEQGLASGTPVVHVSLNYRLGAFGFPTGPDAAEHGAANLALHDVNKALEWVRDNIWAFGGDKSKVTVYGESAGAFQTSFLYLKPDQNLFRGAIMQSGAQSSAPMGPTATSYVDSWNKFAALANCTDDSWNCLKSIPAQQLLDAQLELLDTEFLHFPFAPSINGDIIPDSPYKLLEQGAFARIPFISGNNEDEGTFFFAPNTTNATEDYVTAAIQALESLKPLDNSTLQGLLAVYPDVAPAGAPFGTGDDLFGGPPEFKQLSAMYGDILFQAGRRHFFQAAHQQNFTDNWSYLFTASTPGQPDYRRAFHTADVGYVFGAGYAYGGDNLVLGQAMIQYWLNFATYLDPNGPSLPQWDKYGDDKVMLQLNQTNITAVSDTYREEAFQFLLDNHEAFGY